MGQGWHEYGANHRVRPESASPADRDSGGKISLTFNRFAAGHSRFRGRNRAAFRLFAGPRTMIRQFTLRQIKRALGIAALALCVGGFSAHATLIVLQAAKQRAAAAAIVPAGFDVQDHFPGSALLYPADEMAAPAVGATGTTALPDMAIPTAPTSHRPKAQSARHSHSRWPVRRRSPRPARCNACRPPSITKRRRRAKQASARSHRSS